MIRQNQLFYIIKIAVFFDLFNSHLRLDAGFFVFLVDTVGDGRAGYIFLPVSFMLIRNIQGFWCVNFWHSFPIYI